MRASCRKVFVGLTVALIVLLNPILVQTAEGRSRPLRVVTTLSDYAALTRAIGGDNVRVDHIVQGVQNPHHIRPKPSFVSMIRKADLLITTGLDLELWLPTVVDKSGNRKVRSGESGYVAVSEGVQLTEKPAVISQSEGDVHVFGNPHITTSPIKAIQVARNITVGLIKNDPANKAFYESNFEQFRDEVHKRLFGAELVRLLGGQTLAQLAEKGHLISFLKNNKLQGRPLVEKLAGWMGDMVPLRGTPVVVYHKDWSYLLDLFGLEEAGDVEPKPGIPPSPKHVTELVSMMQEKEIGLLLAANYFDQQAIRTVAGRTGAEAVVLPLFVGGAPGTDSYFALVDHWVDELSAAARRKGLVGK